eukprot:CAMPEP_0196572590 /NCGR_PEP_ID=MMETSP1081-20130531/2612_1 /TAXON_ID=36882 /ORGANISM="Pyramimonas amylifera, Strain CCMP720" /LENGTH=178 /DNA_ID=CAMNT_0041889953 /DNA_START=99 /DNA_END=635 /DNA_ORIENTATION=+
MSGRLAKGMDPLGDLSDDDDEEEENEKQVQVVNEDKLKPNVTEPVTKKLHIDYAALSQHGYRSGPSVLLVPDSASAQQSWNWSDGKNAKAENEEESAEEREKTRQAIKAVDVSVVQALKTKEDLAKLKRDEATERKNQSFNQKEKRKRDMGQASSGKNFIEEEKRLLRQSSSHGLGFD